MKKFENILICTDLDGTLLNSNREISKENIDAIEYFKSEGGFFTFITGRMPSCAVEISDTVKPNVPFGCINGGGLYDRNTGKYISTVELSKEVIPLIEFVDKEFPGVGIQIDTFDNIYFSKDSGGMVFFRKVTGMPNVVRHYKEIDEPFAKIVFGDTDLDAMARLKTALDLHPLANKFTFTRTEKFLYEILPSGLNKSLALNNLCTYLGVPRARSIAIGDYDNDIEMLKAAGIGIAVANATDAAKSAADMITVTNDCHAIRQIISDIEAGKITFGN